MIRKVDVAQRRHRLAHRHLLVPAARTDDIPAIAEALVALHSTDPVTVYLSALARMRNPAVAAVDAALYEQRSIVRHHAMRRTLWATTPELVRAMHPAVTRKIAAAEHRRTVAMFAEAGIEEPEAWLERAKRDTLTALAAGPLTARDLGRAVPALAHPLTLGAGKSYETTVGAHTRVLLLLGFDGQILRGRPAGSWISGAYAYAAADSWLPGGLHGVEERDGCRVLADAWLRRFGPGTTTDLQWWAGWTLATTRQALADAGAEEVEVDEGPAWVAAGDEDAPPSGPWVALLPSLDSTTMGWKERDWYLPADAIDAFDRFGNAGHTVWADGKVVGAWAQTKGGEIRLHWFSEVPARRRTQAQARADELAAWLGPTRFGPRFPGAIQKTILSSA